MLSFEVWINGNKEYTVGSAEAKEFGVYLSMHPELQAHFASIEASGYIPSEQKFSDEIQWGATNLKIGDAVVINVVESNNPDVPSRTKQHIGLVSESTHGMLCSNCGKSHLEIQSFVQAQRVTLCDECISAIMEGAKDDDQT